MTFVGHRLKEPTFAVRAALKPPDFVGSGYELAGQRDQPRIRPNGPPARNAVASRASQRMAVHDPKKHGFALRPSFGNAFVETGAPRDLHPGQLRLLG